MMNDGNVVQRAIVGKAQIAARNRREVSNHAGNRGTRTNNAYRFVRHEDCGWVAGSGLSEAKEAPGFLAIAREPRPPQIKICQCRRILSCGLLFAALGF